MPVTVQFSCGGCFEEAKGTKFLRSRFVGINDKSYGFGHYQVDTIESVTPEGWVAFDPYTGCCYCAKCWIGIVSDDGAAGEGE
jgi:hypothetical protein